MPPDVASVSTSWTNYFFVHSLLFHSLRRRRNQPDDAHTRKESGWSEYAGEGERYGIPYLSAPVRPEGIRFSVSR